MGGYIDVVCSYTNSVPPQPNISVLTMRCAIPDVSCDFITVVPNLAALFAFELASSLKFPRLTSFPLRFLSSSPLLRCLLVFLGAGCRCVDTGVWCFDL